MTNRSSVASSYGSIRPAIPQNEQPNKEALMKLIYIFLAFICSSSFADKGNTNIPLEVEEKPVIECSFATSNGSHTHVRLKRYITHEDSYTHPDKENPRSFTKNFNSLREGDFTISAWADAETKIVEMHITHIDYKGSIAVMDKHLTKEDPWASLWSPHMNRSARCELKTETFLKK